MLRSSCRKMARPPCAGCATTLLKMQYSQNAATSLIGSASSNTLILPSSKRYVTQLPTSSWGCPTHGYLQPSCPVCHLPLTIDLEAPALEIEENINARQGILGRLDLSTWRSSSKIEALVEELSNLRMQDSTTKSLVFSQFVNFLDLIAFRLQRAGFNVWVLSR